VLVQIRKSEKGREKEENLDQLSHIFFPLFRLLCLFFVKFFCFSFCCGEAIL